MTIKQRVAYCDKCQENVENPGTHQGHELRYGIRYESVGQEVLAAHDAAQSRKPKEANGLDLK